MKPNRLGRGLEALIPQISPDEKKERGDSLFEVEIASVRANPFQPRADFHRESLEELKQSIAENGVIQPITVREVEDGYELIAGERRFRAVQELGFRKIPAFVMNVTSDDQMLELALVENIQREDLNPIDLALALQQLSKKYGLTQEEVARKVGKDRATIANFIRLLKLPEKVQDYIRKKEISMGHARALMGLPTTGEQIRVCKKILKQGWSVRKVEDVVRFALEGAQKREAGREKKLSAYLTEAEDKLRAFLGTQVRIKPSSRGGKIEVSYYTDEDIERIIDLLNK